MKLRQRLKRWLYASCPGFAGSFPYYGARVYFPKGSQIFDMLCAQGIYEGENINVINALVRPGSTYLDVGANIGLTALPVLSATECSVISFEPSPNVVQFLQRTATESTYRDRWVVVGKAVGDKVGSAEFFTSRNGGSVYDGLRDTQRGGSALKTSVPMTTIDAEWNAAGRPGVSVIKIDVEGAEMRALQGARSCINSERPYILLEWNALNLRAFDLEPEAILQFAKEIGYRVFGLPVGVPLDDRITLLLQMLRSDSFLLAPEEQTSSLNQ